MIFQIAFAVLNLGVLGGGAFLVYASTLGFNPPKITEEDIRRELASVEALTPELESIPLVFTMDKFTANLKGEPRRVIRVEVNLEMMSKEGFEEVMDLEARAKARDGVLRILNDQEYAELETIQGKLFLKDQIAKTINDILQDGIVKDVYFSDFVVQ